MLIGISIYDIHVTVKSYHRSSFAKPVLSPPPMTFSWKCLMCSKSSFNNPPISMLCKLVGSGMEKKLSMFVFMDSPWRQYMSRESLAGVVVEVFGIRILHLANLQCGRQPLVGDVWHSCRGQGEVGTMFFAGEKENPLDSSFCVIMELKVGKPPCHGGSWRANAFGCVNFVGKCLAFWRQMPLVVRANAFEYVSRCLGLWSTTYDIHARVMAKSEL